MNKYKKAFLQIHKSDLSVKSGIDAVIDPNIAIELDEYGEYKSDLQDIIDNPSTDWESLAKVSAFADSSPNETYISQKLYSSLESVNYNQTIGYYSDLFAGYALEGTFREAGSSGGLTTWLLKELFERGLIDGVIHLKPSNADGILFQYSISDSVDAIQEGAQTKYYPGELSQILRTIRDTSKRYAVVGIPSFIFELRLLAEIDPLFKELIVFTLGLVCGHQKTAKYAEYLAWQIGFQPNEITHFHFRKPIPGNLSADYSSEVTGRINGDNVTKAKTQSDLLGTNWGHGFFKSKFSDFTDDAFNETADVVFGDAWLPEYTSDNGGTNIVIVRSPVISTIFKEGLSQGKIYLDLLEESDILRSQKGLIHHIKDELPYRLKKLQEDEGWAPKKRVTASHRLPLLRAKVQDLRRAFRQQSRSGYLKAEAGGNLSKFNHKLSRLANRYRAVYGLMSVQKLGLVATINKVWKKLIQ